MEDLHIDLTIRISTSEKCFGPGVATLLRLVEKHRSLRAAAATMHMAYSKAWAIVHRAEKLLDCKLLHSSTGGQNGGGAELTETAHRLLDAYEQYYAKVKAYADSCFEETFAFIAEENKE